MRSLDGPGVLAVEQGLEVVVGGRAAPEPTAVEPLLAGVRIGVARDAALAFIYQANLDLLRAVSDIEDLYYHLTH